MTELHEGLGSMYDETQPVLRSLFLFYFGLSETESEVGEIELKAWLCRYARRPSSDRLPPKAMRRVLLTAACRYGLARTCLGERVVRHGELREPEYLAVATAIASELDMERAAW